jgi:outer membrane protein assembly factor BamB
MTNELLHGYGTDLPAASRPLPRLSLQNACMRRGAHCAAAMVMLAGATSACGGGTGVPERAQSRPAVTDAAVSPTPTAEPDVAFFGDLGGVTEYHDMVTSGSIVATLDVPPPFEEGLPTVVAYDASTGKPAWSHQLQLPEGLSVANDPYPSLATAGAKFVLDMDTIKPASGLMPESSSTHVVALDPATGAVDWSKTVDDSFDLVQGDPAGAVLLAGLAGGVGRALDPATGDELWFQDAAPVGGGAELTAMGRADQGRLWDVVDTPTGSIVWDPNNLYSTTFLGSEKPADVQHLAIAGENVLVALYNNDFGYDVFIDLVNARTGKSLIERIKIDGVTDVGVVSAAQHPGTSVAVVHFPLSDRNIFAVDLATGKTLWTLSDAAMQTKPEITVAGNNSVYLATAAGETVPVDISSGAEGTALPGRAVAAPEGYVVLDDGNGEYEVEQQQ